MSHPPPAPELHLGTLDALATPAVLTHAGLHANPACLALLEAEHPAQLLGSLYSDLTHPLDRARARQRVQALSQGGAPAQANEHRLQTCCGNTAWCCWPVHGCSGKARPPC
jgi:PAS domain-containing protein